MEDYCQLIEQHYLNTAEDSTELFRSVLSIADEIGIAAALAHLEKCVIEKRLAWLEARQIEFKNISDPIGEAYRLFFELYLGVSVPADGEIVEKSEKKMVMRWWNRCPTLEACKRLNLDTREVCLKVYHRPVQEFFLRIHPNLRFERNYNALRPHAAYCEEMIVLRE